MMLRTVFFGCSILLFSENKQKIRVPIFRLLKIKGLQLKIKGKYYRYNRLVMMRYLRGSSSALTSSKRSDLPSKSDILSSGLHNPGKQEEHPPSVNFTVTVALTEMELLVPAATASWGKEVRPRCGWWN